MAAGSRIVGGRIGDPTRERVFREHRMASDLAPLSLSMPVGQLGFALVIGGT